MSASRHLTTSPRNNSRGLVVIPWWLWPNVLALDAPAVAVLWQRFLGSAFGVAVPIAASVVLGLTVWGIYLADRCWDARSGMASQLRHRFAAVHPGLIVVAAAALIAAAGIALTLPTSYLLAGAGIAAFVAIYFLHIHLLKPNAVTARGGKEMLVGLLFAAGVAVPLVAERSIHSGWLMAVCGFGIVCWLNCRLIDRWEGEVIGDDIREPSLGIATFVFANFAPRPVALALAAAAALLLIVHHTEHRAGPVAARVLADAALLTPLAVWCFA